MDETAPPKTSWIAGMFIGQAVWGAAMALAFAGIDGASLFAAPVFYLGWFFFWGDGPGRIKVVETMHFTIVFGLVFYGMLGAGVAEVVRRLRDSKRLQKLDQDGLWLRRGPK